MVIRATSHETSETLDMASSSSMSTAPLPGYAVTEKLTKTNYSLSLSGRRKYFLFFEGHNYKDTLMALASHLIRRSQSSWQETRQKSPKW
jgi:hypothetical protein